MIVVPLQSGSSGNCVFVETQTASLLFDAGISAQCAGERLMQVGRSIYDIDALIISHEHSDHIRFAESYARKFNIPVYLTPKTFARAKKRYRLDGVEPVVFFKAGDQFLVEGTRIQTLATPHDAVDGSVFVVSDQQLNVGIFTDIGHVFPELEQIMPTLDGIYIESNYDPKMLREGKYPAYLKRRISGPGGHISNADSVKLLANHASDRLQWICLGHLSEQNNTPEKALEAHRKKLGHQIPIAIASRYEAGPILRTSVDLFNMNPIQLLSAKIDPAIVSVSSQQSLF